MSDEQISDVINEAKIRKELNAVLTQLYAMRDTIIEINNLGKNIGFDGKGFDRARGAKEAIDKLTQAEQRLLFAQSELAKKIAAVNAETEAQNKKNKEAARDALALSDAYGKLSKQYNDAAREAKNLAVTHGIESKAAKDAAARANELGNQLKAIDASVGQYGRNVGHYSQATFALSQILREAPAFAFSFQTGLLALSNNLPILFDQFKNLTAAIDANTKKQLGAVGALKVLASSLLSPINILTALVGIFTIFGPKLLAFASSVFGATKELTAMEKAQAALNEEVKKSLKNTNDEISNAKRLFDVASNVLVPMEARLQAVKDLREQFPRYLKDVKDETILAGNATAAYDKLATSLKQVALTKAILARITKNLDEDLDLEEERTKLQIQLDAQRAKNIKFLGEEAVKAADKVGNNLDGELKLKERIAVIDEKRALIASQNAVLEFKAAEDVTDLLDKSQKEKDKNAKKDKKNAEDALKLAQDNERDRLEIIKIGFEKQAAMARAIVDDDKASYDDRTEALDLYTMYKDSAARIQQQIDAVGVKSVQAANKTKADLDKAYLDNAQENAKELLALQEDYLDDETKVILTAYRNRKSALSKGNLDEESRLLDAYKGGLISTEQYQAAKLQVENKYAILSLQLEAEVTQKILDLRKSRGEDVADQQARLLEITNEIRALDLKYNEAAEKAKRDENDKTTKAAEKNADKLSKANKKTQQEIKDSIVKVIEQVKQFSDPVFSILTNGLEKQKNAIQEQIDIIQEKAKVEIEAIQNSTLSEEEKAARISVIQNVTAAKEKQLEREKRRVQQEQARFERAKAIFDIIANTAVNVVKVFPVVPLMALAAAIGAIQLAAVASRPVPKYAKGRKGGAAEIAFTGDGGKSEIVEHRGRIWVTPNRPTLTYLPEGANVYKDHQTFINERGEMYRGGHTTPREPRKARTMVVDSTGAIVRGNKAIVAAIKDNKPIFINKGQSAFKIAERVQEINQKFYK